MSVDPSTLVKAAGALTKPLVKLIEVVEEGVAAVGRPFIVILTAHADGRAKLIREGYAHRLKKLKAGNRAELVAATQTIRALPASTEDAADEIDVVFEEAEPVETLTARVMETERQAQRRANVMTIAAEAADSMPKDESQVSEAPVEKDWSARFFADAQEVSAEDLQRLWGRILAREVATPGGVPLRTLAILRDLSVKEAGLLQRFATYCAAGGTYVHVPGNGLELHELVALQDAGLVDPTRRNFAWNVIAEGDPDFVFAQARFGSRFTNRLRPSPFVGAALGYPSGHGLLVQAASSDFQVDLYVVRPSAAPLLKLVHGETSLSYLRGVVAYLNSQGFFQARVREPSGWAGEPFGEGAVSPGARLVASREGDGAVDAVVATVSLDPSPKPEPAQ